MLPDDEPDNPSVKIPEDPENCSVVNIDPPDDEPDDVLILQFGKSIQVSGFVGQHPFIQQRGPH